MSKADASEAPSENTQAVSEAPGRMARRAGTVAIFTLGSRILGYIRDAVLAHVFGAGWAFDAFIAAHTIPNALRRLVAEGTLMIAYVPLLTKEQGSGGLSAMRRFTAAVLGLLVPLLLLIVGLGVFFPDLAVSLFASGFEGPQAELASELTRIMMPFLFFVSLLALAAGALNTVGIFGPPAAAPILLNIGIIATVVGFRSYFAQPIYAAAWGVVIGGVVQLIIQVPYLWRQGLLVWPRIELRHPSVVELGRRTLPAVFGVGVYQLNIIIIRQISSFMPNGQLTCYFFASRLQEFALGIFAISISVAALPTLSAYAARNDSSGLLRTFTQALRATMFVTVPAMAGLLVLAEPIVATLLQHGEFDDLAAQMTGELVQILAISLIPIGMVRVLVPTYYAFGDTRTPVWASTASMLTTVGLGTVLGQLFEIYGLTAATAIAAGAQLVILGLLLSRRVQAAVGGDTLPPVMGPLLAYTIRCVALVIGPALLTAWLASYRDWLGASNLENALYLMVLCGVIPLAYFVLSLRFGVSESTAILSMLKSKLSFRA